MQYAIKTFINKENVWDYVRDLDTEEILRYNSISEAVLANSNYKQLRVEVYRENPPSKAELNLVVVLEEIAAGADYEVKTFTDEKGVERLYVVVDNPDYRGDNGSHSNLVIEVTTTQS